jgi:hypothetical protein
MKRTLGVVAVVSFLIPIGAKAGNSEDVIAGNDVALTGGAVVANVQTGGALWFNPAGVARLDSSAIDLTGSVLSYNIIRAPGTLSLESGERSNGDFSAVQAIPRALTFVSSPRPELRWGIGFFFSRSLAQFFQDSVASESAEAETSEFFATADEAKSLYHVSSTVAWKKSEEFLLGGGFDVVIATQRLAQAVSGAYAGGAEGTFSRRVDQSLSGGGLQLKGGLQWTPVPRVRIGWMVATPSYLVYLNEERTETEQIAPPDGPPQFSGTQVDDLRGTWTGVERGLTRLGVAYLGKLGWVEADLIVGFPLASAPFDIDWRTTANVNVGGILRITERLKLGGGFFTDFSPESTLDSFGDTQVDFYGFTVGVDFANREQPPERGQDGFYLAFALALRYSYGKGQLAGLLLPNTFPDPPAQVGGLDRVGITIHEIGANLAIKALF